MRENRKERIEDRNTSIEGVIIKPMTKFNDSRGWLSECFRHDETDKEVYPVMSYVSMTLPGIARGPHEHITQTDYFCFLGPSTFKLYLWDNREASPTYKQKIAILVGEDKPTIAIIPPRVVHAYKNVGVKEGIVLNFPNKLYAGWGKKEKVDEVRHENDNSSLFKLD